MLRRALLTVAIALLAAAAIAAEWPPVPPPKPPPPSQQPSPSRAKASSPPQTQPQPSPQKATPDQRGTEQTPFTIQSVESKEEAAIDIEDRENKTSTDWWMKIFSGAVAIGAFLQIITFVVMIRTSRQQVRAYAFVEVEPGNVSVRPDSIAEVDFMVKNCGQTPAHDLTVWSILFDHDWPSGRIAGTPPEGVEAAKLAVFPGGDYQATAQTKQPLSRAVFDEIQDGKKRVFLVGEVHYRDVFGRPHVTTFQLMTWGEHVRGSRMIYCPDGNNAD